MRVAVSDAVVRELRDRGKAEDGPLTFSDALTLLIHHEMTRDANADDPKTTIREFADLLLDDSIEEGTIREYVALKKHFNPRDNVFTNVMLLAGLRSHRRNRDWMNPDNPVSVQRATALLQAIVLVRKQASEKLLKESLAYVEYGDKGYYNQSFRDAKVADLIMDHHKHYEALINLMLERGYWNGIEVFREMLNNNTPALSNGAL
jgi:hypothetical protein